MNFPTSPTGNGEVRGMEWAGTPGTPLPLRPERAKMNNANSLGSHDMDSEMAADGRVDMRDDGQPTPIHMPGPIQDLSNSRAHEGIVDMKAKPIR
jgi:hypothetical protein